MSLGGLQLILFALGMTNEAVSRRIFDTHLDEVLRSSCTVACKLALHLDPPTWLVASEGTGDCCIKLPTRNSFRKVIAAEAMGTGMEVLS